MKSIFLILVTITLTFFLVSPNIASAETCGVFYKKVNEVCAKFNVPSNAHLTWSGNNWDCNRSFKRSADKQSCEEIKIPENATANWTGDFYCNGGFEKEGNECKKVANIENGRFYEFGADFYCLKGYTKDEETTKCIKIKIPENAREDSSSLDGWICFSGYIKENNGCQKFDLPEHGFWFINYWGCEPGFKKNNNAKTCEKIFIPENAHASDTFDGWLCNSGYTKNYRETRCEKNN